MGRLLPFLPDRLNEAWKHSNVKMKSVRLQLTTHPLVVLKVLHHFFNGGLERRYAKASQCSQEVGTR